MKMPPQSVTIEKLSNTQEDQTMGSFSNLFVNLAMTAGVAVIATVASVAPDVILPAVALAPGLALVFALWQAAVERPTA